MAPNAPSSAILAGEATEVQSQQIPLKRPFKTVIVWRNVLAFAYLHGAAIYGIYLAFTSAKLLTTAFGYLLYVMGGLGITAGAHRLWAHKCYKANTPLQVILMFFNTLAFQNSIFEWSRDHRVHHKFSETNADPHNATRGLFFSHMGWLLCRKHPDVFYKGKTIDLSDLDRDPIVAFQKKYYMFLMPVICFILPTLVPVYFWGETWSNAWFVSTILRYTFTLHVTWLVNSLAHFCGSRPYDKYMNPAENLIVALAALGEGWHNYHHTFPWDYKTAELGHYSVNFTTLFIDFFAKIGWAYDLKSVSPELIAKRAIRTGDGSPIPAFAYLRAPDILPHEVEKDQVWGWDDKDLPAEERTQATVISPSQH